MSIELLNQLDQRIKTIENMNLLGKIDWMEEIFRDKIQTAMIEIKKRESYVDDWHKKAREANEKLNIILEFMKVMGASIFDLKVFKPDDSVEKNIILNLKKELKVKTARLEALESRLKDIVKD